MKQAIRSIRVTLHDSGMVFHDPILERDSMVEAFDIIYDNVADDKWKIIITSTSDYLATVAYLKTVQSMAFVKLLPNGDNLFKGPLGEDIQLCRNIDRVRAQVRMNYK